MGLINSLNVFFLQRRKMQRFLGKMRMSTSERNKTIQKILTEGSPSNVTVHTVEPHMQWFRKFWKTCPLCVSSHKSKGGKVEVLEMTSPLFNCNKWLVSLLVTSDAKFVFHSSLLVDWSCLIAFFILLLLLPQKK